MKTSRLLSFFSIRHWRSISTSTVSHISISSRESFPNFDFTFILFAWNFGLGSMVRSKLSPFTFCLLFSLCSMVQTSVIPSTSATSSEHASNAYHYLHYVPEWAGNMDFADCRLPFRTIRDEADANGRRLFYIRRGFLSQPSNATNVVTFGAPRRYVYSQSLLA